MPLTDTAVKAAKSNPRAYKLTDERGMFLLVTPAGGKLWRLKYRMHGKEKLLALGAYPDVSLREARDRRDDARKLIAAGTDPSERKKAEKRAARKSAADSFEAIAREWHTRQAKHWTKDHAERTLSRLVRDVFPWLGNRPVSAIDAADVLDVLQRVEGRGAIETAHRVKTVAAQIFAYAIATRRAERNPVPDLTGALQRSVPKHRAAITDPEQVGGLLRALDAYEGTFVTKCALRLAPLVFTRPGELRAAEWVEIDLENALWTIPAEKMKMRESHMVPLSSQAVAILTDLKALTGEGRYVFPSARSNRRPMSNNAVLSALRRMGFEKTEMSGHGFRAMARTILDEVLGFRVDFIEHQLAHAVRDPTGRAYNRTAHLAERKKMMQAWADYLDKLKTEKPKQGANVVPIKKTGTSR
jgi:integrase